MRFIKTAVIVFILLFSFQTVGAATTPTEDLSSTIDSILRDVKG